MDYIDNLARVAKRRDVGYVISFMHVIYSLMKELKRKSDTLGAIHHFFSLV